MPVDTVTLRAARAVGIACALALFLVVLASLAFPRAFLFTPYHRIYERTIAAVLLAMGLGLVLALRDPARNAGVFAVIGLVTGFLGAATIWALVVDGADAAHWPVTVPLLSAVAGALVITYVRLRRPHPLVVRIVLVAVLAVPLAFFLYDLASAALVR